jgi:hypothetical protein
MREPAIAHTFDDTPELNEDMSRADRAKACASAARAESSSMN